MKVLASPLVLGGFAVYLGTLVFLWLNRPGIAAENGLMENLQAGTLGLCIFLMLAGTLSHRHFENRFLYAASALLFLAAFLREVDVEKFDLPEWVILLGSGTGRTLLVGLPALLLLYRVVKRRALIKPLIRGIVRTPVFGFFLFGILLYAAGGFFDHHVFQLPRAIDLFMEEFCENAACFYLLAGCLLGWRQGFLPSAIPLHGGEEVASESFSAEYTTRR